LALCAGGAARDGQQQTGSATLHFLSSVFSKTAMNIDKSLTASVDQSVTGACIQAFTRECMHTHAGKRLRNFISSSS